MKYEVAKKYADAVVDWLRPFCERIEIAGSIRRGRAECHDVDVVVVPRVQRSSDLLGAEMENRNLLKEELERYVRENAGRPAADGEKAIGWLTGTRGAMGTSATTNFLIQLRKCELNVFSAGEENFGAVWLTYTGSRESNIWIAERAKVAGVTWSATKGIWTPGGWVGRTEQEIFEQLRLPYIEPADRETRKLARMLRN